MPIVTNNQGQEVIEFIPFPSQKRVLTSNKRFIFAMGGNRGGKTTIGCYWSYLGMQTPGTNGLISANTEDQLWQSTMSKFFEEFPQLQRFYTKRDKMFVLPGNSKVFVRSMHNPELIKGLNLHWGWVDEGDGMSEYAWKILRSRVATTRGKILVTSSIYADSWVYDTVFGRNDPNYDIITWESVENPSFSKEEWEMLKKETDPITFAREYGSQFAFHTGLVYGDILQHGVIDSNQYPEGSEPLMYVFGLDFGVNDPTVITVVSINTDGKWYLVDEHYAPSMNVDEINYWLAHFVKKYGKPRFTCMDTAGGVARLSIKPEFVPFDATKKIFEGIAMLRNMIYRQELFVFGRCVNAIREFKSYRYSNRHPEVPEDRNNHVMDSLRYAIHTTHEMLQPLAHAKPTQEILTPFWSRKMEAGIYKGNGMLEDKDKIDQFGSIE